LRVKPFVKFINYQHMMPTRYNLDVTESLAKIIPDDGLTEQEKKKTIRKAVKETLETRYKNIASGKNEKVTQGVQFFFRCVIVRVFGGC
jgi:large subunit ribosomal protein L27e